MTTGMESLQEGVAPKDWRDNLLDGYKAKGFVVWEIVPQPPDRPMQRKADSGDTYDYETVTLPWASHQDEQTAHDYEEALQLNKQYFGDDNVAIAFPTGDMLQTNPVYAEQPHHVIMVRPTGLL